MVLSIPHLTLEIASASLGFLTMPFTLSAIFYRYDLVLVYYPTRGTGRIRVRACGENIIYNYLLFHIL